MSKVTRQWLGVKAAEEITQKELAERNKYDTKEHSCLHTCLLSMYYVQGTVPGSGSRLGNRMHVVLAPKGYLQLEHHVASAIVWEQGQGTLIKECLGQ